MGGLVRGETEREKEMGRNYAYKGWVLLCPAETAARVGRRNVHVWSHTMWDKGSVFLFSQEHAVICQHCMIVYK